MFLQQYLALVLLLTVQIYKAYSCEEFTDLDLAQAIIGTDVEVKLLLHTRENATCATLLSHTNLSMNSNFNLSRPSIFIIHGYRPTGSPPVWIHKLTEMLLNRSDSNVIVVDWNCGAANVNYFKAVENTHITADNLTAFIQMMKDNGASMSSIHMIGISLGAHISGFVGASFNGSIGRITGLDPAGPTFTGKPPEQRLDSTDAQFVDVLHTDIDSLGFRETLGHVDFYPNKGTDQPGCPKTILSGGSYFKCDHQRSVFLYLESLNRTCVNRAFPCSSYEDFLDGSCTNCDPFGAAGCPVLGYDITVWRDILLQRNKTKLFFTTNEVAPFCRTNYKVDVTIWNKSARLGYLTVKLYGDGKEALATIDHKKTKFKKYRVTKMFAQFDKEISSVEKVSLKFSTGNVLMPQNKLRILQVKLTSLDLKTRPLCRYDILLEENKEVTFKPISCEDSNH
ncbi:unnamed protein product [Ophioblennius macclurei]